MTKLPLPRPSRVSHRSGAPTAALRISVEPDAAKPQRDAHEVPEPPGVEQALEERRVAKGYDWLGLATGGKAIGGSQQQGWRQENQQETTQQTGGGKFCKCPLGQPIM